MLPVIDEVLAFSRDYINFKYHRTPERKAKIKEAIFLLTGERINFGCATCYIEAIYKIKHKVMPAQNYELKRGVFLQPFGHPELAGSNNELTDEKAKKILEVQPGLAIYFSRIPQAPVTPQIRIVPPVNIVQPEKIPDPIETLKEITGEKKVVRKPKAKK